MPSAASSAKTRDALIAAAQDLLAAGNRDASIPEIAKRAGVAVGSLYTHFGNKNELMDAAARAALDEIIPDLQTLVLSHDDRALGFLATMAYGYLLPETNPRLARILVTAGVAGFATDRSFIAGPVESINDSVSRGLCTCDDPEAFALLTSGAYLNVLAIQMSANPVPGLGVRTIKLLGRQLGYSSEQLDVALSAWMRANASTAGLSLN